MVVTTQFSRDIGNDDPPEITPEHSGKTVNIYTDGSCHPVLGIGGWAAIVLDRDKKIVLSGRDTGTTHQRMELTAAIKAIEYVKTECGHGVRAFIYTDSQYLVRLPGRRRKLERAGYVTKTKKPVRNAALVRDLLQLMQIIRTRFIKIRAHEKNPAAGNHNREADMISRKIVREYIRNSVDR
jgi:ribonuclease HI